MVVDYKIEWNKKAKQGLQEIPQEILFLIAKQTLDFSISIIPMSKEVNHAGTLMRSSGRGESGVHRLNNGFFIGSFTDYASYVWNMNDDTTNWTTDDTHSQWFARTLKEKGQIIIDNAINQSWKDTFE